MSKLPRRRAGERGIAILLNAAMIVFTVAVVGLAVDAGIAYLVKAKLSGAVDAAALAAGRSVNLANTVSQATTQATTMAQQFFAANFPSGYFGTTSPTVTPTFTQEVDGDGNITGVLDIAVSASVSVPTYFMRIFGDNSVTVNANGTATRRGLVMMLVLDKSSSMNTASNPTACQAMVTAAQNFITSFSPYDHIGMVSFDYTAHLDYPPSASYGDGSLNTAIGNITCNNNTNTTSALEMAYQQIKNQNLPLAENVIVLFTDGSPNGVSCDFPLRTQKDNRWGPAASSPVPPNQTGSTYGITNSCSDNSTNGAVCVSMPVTCTGGTTVRGTIAQDSNQNSYGGTFGGLYQPMSTDPAIQYPAACNSGSGNLLRQMIAYIPDTDIYGNSTHGVIATTSGPTVCISGACNGLVSRDQWLYQIDNACNPDPNIGCKNLGDLWKNHTNIGSASNLMDNGPYKNYLRTDQPNTIVAASMNTAMAEADKIRADTKFHIVINSIYLTGNGADAIDHEFLPIMSNFATIPALPYDVGTGFTPYANPAFQQDQQAGQYLVTADKSQLGALFAQLASEVLRLSH